MGLISDKVEKQEEEHQKFLEFVAANEREFEALAEDFGEIGGQIRLTSYSLDLGVTGDYEKLLLALRILGRHGWRAESKPKEKEQTYYSWFQQEGGGDKVFFSFSSTVCRRVQVGTETKEVPVYEIRCDDNASQPAVPVSDEIPF